MSFPFAKASHSGSINKIPDQLLSEEVIKAVQENDIETLKSLRKAGKSFLGSDKNHNTLLHLAVKAQKIETLDYLLNLNEIPLEALNSMKRTALIESLNSYQIKNEQFALKLIEHGCNVNNLSEDRRSPLHLSVSKQWYSTCVALIEKGADVNCPNYRGTNPLHDACQNDFLDGIYLLLYHGADPTKCLEVVINKNKPELHELVLCLVPYTESVSLCSLIHAMIHKNPIFPELIRNITKIEISYQFAEIFFKTVCSCQPQRVKLFLDKFKSVFEEMISYGPVVKFLFGNVFTKSTLPFFEENLYTIFSRESLITKIVEKVNSLRFDALTSVYLSVCHNLEENYPNLNLRLPYSETDILNMLTNLFCLMASWGINVSTRVVNLVYEGFGFCELFEILLHMDLKINLDLKSSVWSDFTFKDCLMVLLIHDVNMTVDKIIEMHSQDIDKLEEILDFFALSELVKFDVADLKSSKLKKRIISPILPSLVELGRNSARKYIIEKCNVKNFRQLSNVLKHLPIPDICRKIILYNKRLYV